jgi:hypothetical protein
MSELALFKGGLPAYLKDMQDEATQALAGGSGGGGAKRISIEGGVFRMLVGGKEVAVNEDRSMNMIIVKAAANNARVFYAGTYIKGQVSAPDCWSNDGITSDAKSRNRQAEKCADCPQNIKGSGQGESRACRFQRRLAVIPENEPNGFVYQLTLPSTSIFGDGTQGKWPLLAYAKHLAAHGAPITGVITEMRFDTSSPTPKLVFKPVRPITEDEFNMVQAAKDAPEAQAAVTMTVAQTDGVRNAPAALPEPKVAAKKTEPDTKLSDLLNEFDDE